MEGLECCFSNVWTTRLPSHQPLWATVRELQKGPCLFGAANNRNLSSHGFGGQESEIRVSVVLDPSRGSEGPLFQLLVAASNPWHPWFIEATPSLLSFL